MAELSPEKSKVLEKQAPAKQAEFQIGGMGHQVASGIGAGVPPLDKAAMSRIQRSPQHALRSDLLALQRAVGNRAVAALVRGEAKDVAIQARLEVGPVNDVYEREADHIARLVTSDIAQRKPAANVKSHNDEGEEGAFQPEAGLATNIKRMVQRKSADSGVRADGSFTTNAHVQDRIRRMERGGRPLPDMVRREMEPRFGADFSGVRIHTNGEAVQLSRDIGARAFTHGSHIAFGARGFNPNSQGGRHLLAHELTHTIQQTGARPISPVQRSPKGTIQRGVLSKIREFFGGKKAEPVIGKISAPITGTATQIQAAAFQKVNEAWDTTVNLHGAAMRAADLKAATANTVNPEMEQAGAGARVAAGKTAVGGMKKGDEAMKGFIVKYKQDLDELRRKIDTNRYLVLQNNEKVVGNGGSAKQLALQSHMLADEAAQLVEKLREQADAAKMNSRADTEQAFARSGMTGRTLGYDARSVAAAEKAASDSVMDLMTIQGKVRGYFLYLDADRKVLQESAARKAESVSSSYGNMATFRAMGSATARSGAEGDPGMLSDDQAFGVGGGGEGMEEQETSSPTEHGMTNGMLKNMGEGRAYGEGILEQGATAKGKKPNQALSKNEKKFAKQVKRLEIRHMLYIKAEKRASVAKQSMEDVDKLYIEAHALYIQIDGLRKSGNQTPEIIDQATRAAGDARVKVATAAVHMAKLRKFKEEVYKESQTYEKYTGPRAMSKTKRRLKKLGGMVGGAGLRALTGGLYGIEAQDEAGGYRVGIKSRTIIDDVIRKHFELKQIMHGVNDNPVHGLGGRDGARAYVFFKGISFALQIVRDISAAVALWVTLITGGAGAPVGAVFASLALFAGLSKAAVDLLLLIWSAVGLGKTNDPRSRAILRGENTRQGLAFAEGAFVGASAGLVMGLSGNTGLVDFGKQTAAFGSGSQTGSTGVGIGDSLASAGVGPAVPALGNIGAGVGVNALSPYVGHANLTSLKHEEQLTKVRKAKTAIRAVSNPAREAFLRLSEFAQKKKKMRQSKFVAILPDIAKTIEEMGETVQEVPERGGGGSNGGGGMNGGPNGSGPNGVNG